MTVSLKIEPLYLPGDSPNRNQIELLRLFVSKQSLDSIYYEGFEPQRTAIDKRLDGLSTLHKVEMETLLADTSQTLQEMPLFGAQSV